MGYREDRAKSDRYIPAIRQIVGPHLLVPAPLELDVQETTDLLVFRARDMRVATRIRFNAESWPYDFTIRARRDNGTKTELSKIVEGWGDWLFYGHAAGETTIGLWWIIDLASFRAALIRRRQLHLRIVDKANGDGTYFKAF